MRKIFTTIICLLIAFLLAEPSLTKNKPKKIQQHNEIVGSLEKATPGFSKRTIQDNYIVHRGERPPIDLTKVSEDAFKRGRIQIKLSRSMENEVRDQILIAGEKGYVRTKNPALDALNEEFGVKMYKPLLHGLYDLSERSVQHRERHKAWGFHLWFELEIDEHANVIDAVKKYASLKEVELAEAVYKKVRIGNLPPKSLDDVGNTSCDKSSSWTPNDPMFNQQWHYHNTGQEGGTPGSDIDLIEAWGLEKGHSDVIVAIVDNGVQYDHPDLADNMWSEIGPEGTSTTPANHGTHVAGTVAAVTNNNTGVAGIAGGSGSGDGVRIMSVDLLEGNHGMTALALYIYQAENNAAISQNSWKYTEPGVFPPSTKDGIDYFNAYGGGDIMNGGITIFAAGNDNNDGNWYPPYYSGVMSVAATNNKDEKSYYSNYGAWVDISAPGGETFVGYDLQGVFSTITGGTYDFRQGTSMSCPHVSGVAALLASYAHRNNYILTNQQVWDFLVDNTDNHYAQNPDYTGMLGSGRLNAMSSMNALVQYLNEQSGMVNVTLNVDMTDVEGFDHQVHEVYVTGTFTDWAEPGTEGSIELFGGAATPQVIFYENFNAGVLPDGWLNLDENGDGNSWFFVELPGHEPYDGDYAMASASWEAGTILFPDNWLITHQVENVTSNYTLSFQVKAQDPSYPAEKYDVLVSTTGNDPADFTSIFSETLSSGNWQERVLELGEFAGEDIYIAFRHWDCSDWFQIVIDAIKVEGTPAAKEDGLLYTVTVPIVEGFHEYKYFSNAFGEGWDGGEWEADSYRELNAVEGLVQNDVWSEYDFLSEPVVTTAAVTDITETTATSGGEVTSDGGAEVTAHGVVWSTGQNPTVENNLDMTEDGTGTGSFVSNIAGLSPETTYYVQLMPPTAKEQPTETRWSLQPQLLNRAIAEN